MISFYPGPSRIHSEIPDYVKEAYKKGILSINHRSEEFVKISEKTIGLLKERLNIPKAYTVYYTSSATECWEIIAQSVIAKRSYHLFNGSFGQKWFEYTKRICPGARDYAFDKEEILNPKKYRFGSGPGVICITQNETSNGTQVSPSIIREIKKNNPGHLIAIDATSSIAGIELDFKTGDIWFASVQKCFGLPAGLGLMVCSPEVLKQVKKINEKEHYNSLTFMTEMMAKWQTSFTPNVLGIYLLMRVLEDTKPITAVHKKIVKRYDQWMEFMDSTKTLKHLVKNENVHSYTVIPVTASTEFIIRIKKEAKQHGFLLGEGYGDLKNSTFRIANFPAIKKKEIEKLQRFLKSFQ
jgi:phosphoserine aminotransferase